MEKLSVELYFARHGKTMLNTADRMQGWADTPLTDEGTEIASFLGKGLRDQKFISVYTSDSGRTIETAKIVLENSGQTNLKIQKRKQLREVCFGDHEGELNQVYWDKLSSVGGFSIENFHKKPDIKAFLDLNVALDTSGQAENWEQLITRTKSELDRIVQESMSMGGGKVLIVSHGVTIMTLLREMSDDLNPLVPLENSSISKVVYEDGDYKILSMNDMTYIKKGMSADN
ncbi:MAG: histidine phosphatase family protein [Clostridiales bacterium]|nr:histidine phosphatase family protein [Clostridiales bacterium]